MSRELNCNSCKKHMATLRDASVRKGMVVYCESCDKGKGEWDSPGSSYCPPEFISTLFGGKLK
jgi:hypothetical protein